MPTRLLILVAALSATPAYADGTLIVQVRSDLRRGTDFHRVEIKIMDSEGRRVSQHRMLANHSNSWARGVRVVEVPLRDGLYRLSVSALTATNRVVVQRPVRVELKGGVRVVTVLLTLAGPRPAPPDACQQRWNQQKRQCGRLLGACIRDARGRRDRIKVCQDAQGVCKRSADRGRDQCRATKRRKMKPKGHRRSQRPMKRR